MDVPETVIRILAHQLPRTAGKTLLVEAFDLGRGCIGLPVYGATAGRSTCLVIEGGLLCTGIDRKVLWWALVERSPNKKNGDENTKGDQAEAATRAGKAKDQPESGCAALRRTG